MKTTQQTTSSLSIDGTKLIAAKIGQEYYVLLTQLADQTSLSFGIVQRAAVRRGIYYNHEGFHAVQLDNLHSLLCELKRRYSKNSQVFDIWTATLPEEVDEGDEFDEGRKTTVDVAAVNQEAAADVVEDDKWRSLGRELLDYTKKALEHEAVEDILWVASWIDADDKYRKVATLWGDYVHYLHTEQGLFPRLPYRLYDCQEHKARPLGKLATIEPKQYVFKDGKLVS